MNERIDHCRDRFGTKTEPSPRGTCVRKKRAPTARYPLSRGEIRRIAYRFDQRDPVLPTSLPLISCLHVFPVEDELISFPMLLETPVPGSRCLQFYGRLLGRLLPHVSSRKSERTPPVACVNRRETVDPEEMPPLNRLRFSVVGRYDSPGRESIVGTVHLKHELSKAVNDGRTSALTSGNGACRDKQNLLVEDLFLGHSK